MCSDIKSVLTRSFIILIIQKLIRLLINIYKNFQKESHSYLLLFSLIYGDTI